MNTISTIGDLRKALSAYPEYAPLKVFCDHKRVVLNNDTQIYAEFSDLNLAIGSVHISLHADSVTNRSAPK